MMRKFDVKQEKHLTGTIEIFLYYYTHLKCVDADVIYMFYKILEW